MKSLFRTVLALVLTLVSHSIAQAGVLQDHLGRWQGDLKIPNGPTFKIGAELFIRADGSYWASVASPDQGAYDIPVKSIKETGDTAELDLSFATLKLQWVKDHFDGVWVQGPGPLPLTLTQVTDFPRVTRSQAPKAPFPYRDEILAIPSADGVTLGATLSIPNGKVHPTVVILVHGSGPGTRDLDVAGHQQFSLLSDYLARQGVAVLRYDKRGVSRSTGD